MNLNLHFLNFKVLIIYAVICFSGKIMQASTGDTLVIHGFDHFTHRNCNSGNAYYLFPSDSINYYKIMLRYELSCPPALGCDIYDRIATLKVLKPTGAIDSSLSIAPSFRMNGNVLDSFAYMNTVSYTYSYNTLSHRIDSTQKALVEVYLYNDSLSPFTATDTLLVWPSYYNQYTFDSTGVATDSAYVVPDSVLYLSRDSIYTPFEVKESYEIARAITPYGQGVVLWFDVSDYRPLLHDSVNLFSVACGYSNGWDVTTDFYFIEGIPPMHPYKITNLWNGTWQYGNTANPIDNHLQPISLLVDSQSVYDKIRLITTGHGFGCSPNQNVAEFFDVTHHLNVNGSNLNQRLWRSDCGRNPLYPQGGPGRYSTWYYKRANWCPGSYVKPYDYNVTSLVNSNDSLTVDYNLQAYTVTNVPSGAYAPEYYIQSQAIFYDNIQYTNNAALLEVHKPNGAFEYNRMNPICSAYSPEVLIKNYGRDTLHALTIHYGIDGVITNTFSWTGNLILTDTVSVILPPLSFGAGNHTFDVYIDQPNGNNDEYLFDDTLHVNFIATNVFDVNYMRVRVKTDNFPAQTHWTITDDQGNVVASHLSFTTQLGIYNDTVMLANGCYTFKIIDNGSNGGDGICCYNGAGYLRLYFGADPNPFVSTGDYGEFYSLNFSIDFQSGINDPVIENLINVFPNPASNGITLNTSIENARLKIDLLDVTGKTALALENVIVSGYSTKIDFPQITDGIYFLRINMNEKVYMKKIIISKN
jgi:hypothetical protein